MTDGLSEAYEAKRWDVFCENNDLLLENDQLKAENAKLRGMVAVLWECCACNTDSFWCDGCDYHDDVDGCKVEKALHKLGIEVSA